MMPHPPRRQWPVRPRGAALLLAMLIVTLVATLAAGMLWQQWRAIEVERAERNRTQAAWLMNGTMDWARMILREDARGVGGRAQVDSLDEGWAIPLRDLNLRDFLAAGANAKEGAAQPDVGDIDASLSGQITDAQARYNLTNLVGAEPEQQARLQAALAQLCVALALPAETAQQIVLGMSNAAPDGGSAPIAPMRAEQLAWLGLPDASVQRLLPYVTVLPEATPVNANTASAEVLMTAVDGLDRSGADRIVRGRPAGGFESINALKALLPATTELDPARVSVATGYFEILGELRLEGSVLRERALVQRQQLQVTIVRRERLPPPLP